jgi:hypothetical protein
MKFTTIASSLLLTAQALAQTTPVGFTPATNATLDVYYGTQYISPGLVVRKSSAQLAGKVKGRKTLTVTSYPESARRWCYECDSDWKVPARNDWY